ncbi:GumC family protein [Chitinimonas taiwanensis]|uniref:GumC family protein n=1 Tax=Chitinimonas taiwanensis TaxID=240412 RepID=UPI0035AE1BF4
MSNNQELMAAPQTETEISLLDLIRPLWRARKTIGMVAIVGFLVCFGVASLLPKVYTAKTIIMPPQQQQSAASAALAQLGGLAGGAGAALGVKNPAEIYISMLKSRSVTDAMVSQFGLIDYYQAKLREEAIETLLQATQISSGKDGLISISVESRDPKHAAAMANAYVAQLRRVAGGLAVTAAAQRRLFFESQLKSVKERLATSEARMAEVQMQTGILQLEGEARSTMERIAQLRAQVSALEIQAASMRQGMTVENPEYQRGQAALQELRKELQVALSRQSSGDKDFLSRSTLPSAALEYLRSAREVKYNELLMDMIARQFEAARLDEANEGALIQVLDVAQVPERKSRPRRLLIAMMGGLLGLFISSLFVLIRPGYRAFRLSLDNA